eukprot:COSAG04_NODE_33246_length_164_cov_130.153846_1_plen_31_part_10
MGGWWGENGVAEADAAAAVSGGAWRWEVEGG